MNEISILKTTTIANRGAYQQKIIQAQKERTQQQEYTATILGYDSATGNYNVQNETGSVVSARAISNSSALCKGAAVSLVTPRGGIPIIDAMPR